MQAQGVVILLTGLSGAGKSTVARAAANRLKEHGLRVTVLDGDVLRAALHPGLGFSRAERALNVRSAAYLAELLSEQGVCVILALIAPFEDVRRELRTRFADYREVYLECSLDELRRRDVKGLYAEAAAGTLHNLTGVSDPYEIPSNPDLILQTDQIDLDACARCVVGLVINERGGE